MRPVHPVSRPPWSLSRLAGDLAACAFGLAASLLTVCFLRDYFLAVVYLSGLAPVAGAAHVLSALLP